MLSSSLTVFVTAEKVNTNLVFAKVADGPHSVIPGHSGGASVLDWDECPVTDRVAETEGRARVRAKDSAAHRALNSVSAEYNICKRFRAIGKFHDELGRVVFGLNHVDAFLVEVNQALVHMFYQGIQERRPVSANTSFSGGRGILQSESEP